MMALAGDPVYNFGDDDPAMQSAISQARDTLPVFLRRATDQAGRSRNGASLKVEFVVNEHYSEVIWVSPFRQTSTGFRGNLANEPAHMKGKHTGSNVRFTQDQISDWSLSVNDKLYGNYTTRAMLPQLDKKSRASLRRTLSKRPMPSNW